MLLDGVRVVDLTADCGAMTGRVLAQLGADVVRIGPPVDPAWEIGCRRTAVEDLPDELAGASLVLVTPGAEGTVDVSPAAAPDASWILITPFGGHGPRARWRGSDLGVMAASGNLWATGDPDRPPVRCAMPVSQCHTGPEAAFAALTALASGRPQVVDVSMQEVVVVANMGAGGRYFRIPQRGRRVGANIGRTREIWPCADGWVSFGLRGGKARVPSLTAIGALAGLERDWTSYEHNAATDDELRAIEAAVGAFFAERTVSELYELACERNLMLAPINGPKELYESKQLAARAFFDTDTGLPGPFVHVKPGPVLGDRPASVRPITQNRAWEGTNLLEFGAGAAGPIATRYFAEHGATVIRIESRSRPDFLRTYSPKGIEGSDMFDALNCGKLGITLNLKHERGREIALRLITEWADAVSENFAPKAMRGFGLDYETVATHKPDLVMISACLMGQTGPHRDYPGFGGQGSALSGFNFLTGWPDRAPLGPFGTITDSLAPRFVATALAAGLLHRRRTGQGAYLDLSQVECAAWSLSPWLRRYREDGTVTGRSGNDDPTGVARVHTLVRCEGDDRWVAVVAWTDDEADRLHKVTGGDLDGWCRARTPLDAAVALQAERIEAVPVQDFGDLFDDPQLAARDHLVALDHPVLGEGRYERNGFRLSGAPSVYDRPAPTLGQHNAEVLGGILGLSAAEQARLEEEGALT